MAESADFSFDGSPFRAYPVERESSQRTSPERVSQGSAIGDPYMGYDVEDAGTVIVRETFTFSFPPSSSTSIAPFAPFIAGSTAATAAAPAAVMTTAADSGGAGTERGAKIGTGQKGPHLSNQDPDGVSAQDSATPNTSFPIGNQGVGGAPGISPSGRDAGGVSNIMRNPFSLYGQEWGKHPRYLVV